MEISSHDITNEGWMKKLNNSALFKGKKLELVEGETLDPYTDYYIHQDGKQIYHTIYPKELLIKLAQLLPETEVKLGRYNFTCGGEDLSQETLVIKF